MKKITIPVSGMHCASCEVLLEKSIGKIKNVSRVEASEKAGKIEVEYDKTPPNMKQIEEIVTKNGYSLGKAEKLPWITAEEEDYFNILLAGTIVFVLNFIAKMSGFSFWSASDTASPSLGISFLIGLTAGVSSCMALIGGLVLGISAKWNKEHSEDTVFSRFAPHLYFHLGRILGFGLLGGILGLFGSVIRFSNLFLGFATLVVGVIMVLLGLNLTNLSPRLGSFSLKLPKFLGKNVNGEGTGKMSVFVTGMATFFLPCGFTLAMQAYAVSTGNFMAGAMAMALFALGTVPGLLSIGFVSAVLRGNWLKRFFTFTGVIVLALGFFNFNNGYALLSLGSFVPTPAPVTDSEVAPANPEVQEIRMVQDGNGYAPNIITIDAGKKIRWIVTGKNPYTCSTQLIVPQLGISKSLVEGENVIEFIAPKSGEIPFSCSMGMYRGKFVVNTAVASTSTIGIDSTTEAPVAVAPAVPRNAPSGGCGDGSSGCGGSSGGGCAMMGGSAPTPTTSATVQGASSGSTDAAETIPLTYTATGLSQNVTVKKGNSYKIAIDVKETISGCMSTIRIPKLDDRMYYLEAGNTITFTINPTETGKFPITCAMGVPHGYVTAE